MIHEIVFVAALPVDEKTTGLFTRAHSEYMSDEIRNCHITSFSQSINFSNDRYKES